MITMILMFLIGFGIIAVIVSAALSLFRWIFSLPVIGGLAIIFIIILLFFRI